MAKYRVAGRAVVRIDSTAGGSLSAITSYVDTISAFGRAFAMLDITQFVDAAERIIPGIETSQEITLDGAFDDTASTGPDAIFAPNVGNGTSFTFEWDPVGTASGARKFTTEVYIMSYQVLGEVKGRVNYRAVLKQDGTITVGTN